MINEPIIALATAPIKGALSLLRLSGDNVIELTSSLLSKPIDKNKGKQIVYGHLDNNGHRIDDVVVVVFVGPNSFTGQDSVEISCHGSMLIVNEIIEAYLSKGVRYATAGEFSSRAFLNGKIDLIQAESINDLINATTKEAKNLALSSLSGDVSKLAHPLKKGIADILALVEVGIDFPEYDEEEKTNNDQIAFSCDRLIKDIDSLIVKGEEGKIVKQGVNVAIVGEPNVGKSTLLNALLEQDKAIVSDIPGTTRDIVEGDALINGLTLHLLDTAGIRETSDKIESIGVNKSKKSIENADLVIFLADEKGVFSKEIEKECLSKKTIKVINKSDLIGFKKGDAVYISAKNNDIDNLKTAIKNQFMLSDDAFITPSFSNERELGCLKRMRNSLSKAKEDAENGLDVDIISVSLQEAYNEARLLLGEEKTLDLSDEIFSRFCVGK